MKKLRNPANISRHFEASLVYAVQLADTLAPKPLGSSGKHLVAQNAANRAPEPETFGKFVLGHIVTQQHEVEASWYFHNKGLYSTKRYSWFGTRR